MLTSTYKHIALAFDELLSNEQRTRINEREADVYKFEHDRLDEERMLLANPSQENAIAYATTKQALEIATTRLESTVQMIMNEIVKR